MSDADLLEQRRRFERLRMGKKNRGVIMRPGVVPLGEYTHAYVTPDFPQGITVAEWKAADSDVKLSVAISWFLQNHAPDLKAGPAKGGRRNEIDTGYTNIPDRLHFEFENVIVLGLLGSEIEDRLYQISGVWKTVPSPPDFEPARHHGDLVQELLLRIGALEAAMTQAPGIGHNNPPLSSSEILSVRSATDTLEREAVSDAPDVVAIVASVGTIKRAYLAVGKWLLQKLDKAVDESIKWGVPVGMVEAIALSQRLDDVLNLATQLLHHLGAH